jgi:superfamily II DNA helicase RecQ
MKVCLDLFINRGIVGTESGRRYRLLQPDLSRDALARAGESYRERHERDTIKQRQVVEYAEGGSCRWRTLLHYFGSEEELPGGRCGHCDYCA